MRQSFPDQFRLRDLLEASSSAYFASLPDLETPRLLLRRMRLRDAADMFEYTSDPQVARYVLWDPHRSQRETRRYIRAVRSQYRQGVPSSWAIELKAEHKVIGSIGYMWYSPDNRSAEVGYSLSRAYWNRGFMSEALQRVILSAFQDLRLHRVEAQHDVRNPASGRVMEKCGMRKEGILRARLFSKGEYVDTALWSILREELEESSALL